MLRSVFTTSAVVLFFLGIPYVPQLAEEVDIQALPPAAKSKADFSRDVEPLFRERCYACHGPQQQMNGLRLDSKAAALAGGYSGPVIKPGNSAASKLIHLVAGLKKDLIMPMGGERLTPEQVGTSLAERQNLTMRMNMRRFTRLTNAFSKKLGNLKAALALHFAWYNFVRVHRSLRVTPAMEAGITSRVWAVNELIA